MKPGILCVANWPSDVGYAWWLMESYWSAIAKHFSESYQTYIAFPEINEIPQVIQESPIQSVEHQFRAQSIVDSRRNIAFLKSHNIQVIYLSDYPVSAFEYALYRLAGVKTIISHDHTPGMRTKAVGIRRTLKSIKANLPWCSVDAAFGATTFVTDRLHSTNCLNKNKCFTVQNGIPIDTTEAEHKAPEWLPADSRFTIVTASRANKYKGILFAIDVMAELVNRGCSDFHYVFCGDGPHLQEFIEYAESKKVSEFCSFPGRVPNVADGFAFCSLGFQPSSGEVGYSLSIIEYMYAGIPVVVPDNPSVCAATKHTSNGRVYKEGDVSSASDQIQAYIQNAEACEDNGRQAKRDVEDYYTLDKTHEALLRAFSVAVSEKPKGQLL